MTIPANHFSWGGYTAGAMGTEGVQLYTLVAPSDAVNGLHSPERRTQLSDLQGHGQRLGSQWANARRITATVWTESVDVAVGFDATMVPRPDPTDVAPWIGNFASLGERLCWAVPESCTWAFDDRASIGMWRLTCSWIAPDPTIYSVDESDLSWGGGGSPVPYADLTVTNDGTSTADVAWTLRIQAHGTVTDPYIQIQGDSDRAGESVRFTGLTMTSGQVLRVDRDRLARVGDLIVDGLARTRGQRLVTWPRLEPGTQTVRVGAITGNISGNFHHRSTWSV